MTGPKHASDVSRERVDGFEFYRTPGIKGLVGRTPMLNQLAVISGLAERSWRAVQPDVDAFTTSFYASLFEQRPGLRALFFNDMRSSSVVTDKI